MSLTAIAFVPKQGDGLTMLQPADRIQLELRARAALLVIVISL